MNFISLICFIVAPMFKALADVCNNRFNISVLKNKNPKFWAKDTSAQYAPKIFSYRVDAWHLSMSMMLVLLIMFAIFHHPVGKWYVELVIWGVYWNACFNIFYNKILMDSTYHKQKK
jgi:hypothetical protein